MRALSSGVTLNVLNTLLPPSRVKLEEMITLAVLKSTHQSGTVKKMLHAPTLKLYNVKEVPLWSRETRKSIKEWISLWQHSLNEQPNFVTVNGTYWNVPEGCVSILQDHCYCGSLLVPRFFRL